MKGAEPTSAGPSPSFLFDTTNEEPIMSIDHRLAFRATTTDLHNLAVIATGLRATGQTFANRTDAIRHALAMMAAAFAVPSVETVPNGVQR